jgi:hypothetical protein
MQAQASLMLETHRSSIDRKGRTSSFAKHELFTEVAVQFPS